MGAFRSRSFPLNVKGIAQAGVFYTKKKLKPNTGFRLHFVSFKSVKGAIDQTIKTKEL